MACVDIRGSEISPLTWIPRSDFVYMVPPFIAYYGALQGGDDGQQLLQIAYDQCRLYRDALADESGLWRHISLGSWQDENHWATGIFPFRCFILFLGLELIGNAWAAAGMLRVHQTLKYSSEAEKFVDQQANLTQWINEILGASWAHQVCLIFAYVMLLLLNFECTTFHRHRMVVSVMLLTTRHPTLTQHRRPS